jgi:ATPase subunit of ABC transporter with duplicated ATPase domains
VDSAFVPKEYALGLELAGEASKRNVIVRIDADTLPLGESRSLRFDELIVRPADRIAITGPNGAGKTTLVRHVLSRLDLPVERVVYVPQEIDRASSARILADVRQLAPTRLGRVMAGISCLGSRPQRLLESDEPSPGELRKLLLALGLSHAPHLIVMDEPTNHLDLPSIQCMEEALAQVCCALLLVSHDEHFLARVTQTRWRIEVDAAQKSNLTIELTPSARAGSPCHESI